MRPPEMRGVLWKDTPNYCRCCGGDAHGTMHFVRWKVGTDEQYLGYVHDACYKRRVDEYELIEPLRAAMWEVLKDHPDVG